MNAPNQSEAAAWARHDDIDHNASGNPSLMEVFEARLSRRGMLRVGMGSAGAGVLATWPLAGCGGSDASAAPAPAPAPAPRPLALSFDPVAKNLADRVTVPPGYTATVVYALGDPLAAGTPAFRNDGTDTGFDQRSGDHHDGMEWFGLDGQGRPDPAGSARGVLAINHEAITDHFLHAAGASPRPRPAAETDKEVDAHGLSFVEVRRDGGRFAYQQGSAFNRRVTPLTPIRLSGPARGHALLRTKFSPAGTDTRGTINNCGGSTTPWGTSLAGEENWVNYFTRGAADDAARGGDSANSVVSLRRYGKAQGAASRAFTSTSAWSENR